jgi:hypothetical protein
VSFTLKDYNYDPLAKSAHFFYSNDGLDFEEAVIFTEVQNEYNEEALNRALFLAFVLMGTSYYKTSPSQDVVLEKGNLDDWQVEFFNKVYQEGLSQFAFENNLTRKRLANFSSGSVSSAEVKLKSTDVNPLVLQSGGKDSLLLATLLSTKQTKFSPWYLSSGSTLPEVLNELDEDVVVAKRVLDVLNLKKAREQGGFNGHVPVTYMVLSISLIQAILLGKDTILAAIGHEGEEPYDFIGDLPVRHQWSKTWQAEKDFAEYVGRYVSKDIKVGSALRKYSELKIAEMFVEQCWVKYSREFSSCNVGNYKQGHDNSVLGWCGNCAKCANSFLLFAPFVEPEELIEVFGGENLFSKTSLQETFKGLLGVEGVVKPFECVGEEAELRTAYHMAASNFSKYELSFEVPESDFNYNQTYDHQAWADKLV